MRQSRPQLLWVSPQTLPRSRMRRDFQLRPLHSQPYQKATEEFCGRAVVCPRVLRFCCARAFECSEIPGGLSTSSRTLNLICMLFVWMHVRAQMWTGILRGLTAISIFAPIARPIPSHVMASYSGSWGLYLFICSFKASVFGPRRMSMCIPPSSPSPSPIHADIRPSYYTTQSHSAVLEAGLTSTMRCRAKMHALSKSTYAEPRCAVVNSLQGRVNSWVLVKVTLATHSSPKRFSSSPLPIAGKLGPWFFQNFR